MPSEINAIQRTLFPRSHLFHFFLFLLAFLTFQSFCSVLFLHSLLVLISFPFFPSSFKLLTFPFWAAAPKGPMTYAFTQEKFLLLLLLLLLFLRPPSKLIF